MTKRKTPRKICFLPDVTYFKPAGVKMALLDEVELGHDEVEAIRLKHLVKLDQETAAQQMGVSQPTFHRLLNSAHEKLAEAVIKGKALRIEGGNVSVQEGFEAADCGRPRDCGRRPRKNGIAFPGNRTLTEGPVRIVVASNDGTLEGSVNERFGRCKRLVVYDPGSKTVGVIDNNVNMRMAQGAGIEAAQAVVDSGARVVISGHFGPKAFQVLHEAGIDIYGATSMSVSEALLRFEQGRLEKLSGPNTEPHW
jgi:uncharacterized protein